MTHKLFGGEGSHFGYSDVQAWPTQPAGTHSAGQHLGNDIHQPQRRYSLPTTDEPYQHPLGVVPGLSDSSASHTSSGDPQCAGRPTIPTPDEQVRLETQSTHLSEHHALVWSTGDGLVSVSTVNSATPFLQLEARSRSLGNGCVQSGLDPVSKICEFLLVPCYLRWFQPTGHQIWQSCPFPSTRPRLAVFFPTDLRKQDRPGHKHTTFIIPAFEGDALTCPLQCLNSYIRKTSPLRTEADEGPFFISFVKPHKPVSSASLARWRKSALESRDSQPTPCGGQAHQWLLQVVYPCRRL